MRFSDTVSACVVLAAEGYPAGPRVGDAITGVSDAEAVPGVVVFHAGTARDGDQLVTAGGRVLSVTAVGSSLSDAVDLAYRAAERIRFNGVHRRSDIGADTLKEMD
jgi:phosphoribosylamine--glycine ligase